MHLFTNELYCLFRPLVQVDGATSISTISLVDVDVESFSSYIYQPTPWAKHTKTTVSGAPSLGNPSCSKLYVSSLSLAVVVAVTVVVAVAVVVVVTSVRAADEPSTVPSSALPPLARHHCNPSQ